MNAMDFTAEWKSLFPASSSSSPLFLPCNSETTGPLLFSIVDSVPTLLLHSKSIIPPCFLTVSQPLSLSKFILNYGDSVLPSVATAISTDSCNDENHNDDDDDDDDTISSHFHAFNYLQLLPIPNHSSFIAFFPTGDNSHELGFSLLTLDSPNKNHFQTPKHATSTNKFPISHLLVNPFEKLFFDDDDDDDSNTQLIGFVMVCTEYSVFWYKVLLAGNKINSVSVDYIGRVDSKTVKGFSVANACWSPHMREECLVLLKDGRLLLFDLNYDSHDQTSGLMSMLRGSYNNKFVPSSVEVKLQDHLDAVAAAAPGSWFACQFSFHPRKFIVSHSNAVFMVDGWPSGKYEISCLLKLDVVSSSKTDAFMALSRAGGLDNGFNFAIATRSSLLLCDVRWPMKPKLTWEHKVENPRFMTVFKLSDLRANAEADDHDDNFKWASQCGYGILLGSFWDSSFSLFCYGLPKGKYGIKSSGSSEILKFCNTLVAWGLPSELLLSDRDCNCGSCLMREYISETESESEIETETETESETEELPNGSSDNWRHKKNFVIGFDILDADTYGLIMSDRPKSGFGGFVLVRLMSSGKLEAMQYHAVSEFDNSERHKRKKSDLLEDNRLYNLHDPEEYDDKKGFTYFSFDYLDAYLSDNLTNYMGSRIENIPQRGKGDSRKKGKFNFHDEICQKHKDSGFDTRKSSWTVSDVLKDVSLPTSINELALLSTLSALPTSLLQMGRFKDEVSPQELLDIAKQLQLPPSLLRKPSDESDESNEVGLYDNLLPPHFLTTLNNLRMEERKNKKRESESSSCVQFKHKREEVMEFVEECVTKTEDVNFVSQADGINGNWPQNMKLNYHKPLAFSEDSTGFNKEKFSSTTHVFKKRQGVESNPINLEKLSPDELFDMGCPIQMKFDNKLDMHFGENSKELKLFQNLKKLELNFQNRFKPYQDYINGSTSKPK